MVLHPEGSKGAQKGDQIGLLLVGESDVETLIVELNDIRQRGSGAVVEIGCARRQPAQDRSLHFADVGAFPGDQGATRIGDLEHLSGQRPGCAPDRKNRQSGNIQGGGLAARAFATLMFNGALTEWFPTFGVSWQVPQNPGTLGWLRTSFSPATPVIFIFVVLNSSSPRAIA